MQQDAPAASVSLSAPSIETMFAAAGELAKLPVASVLCGEAALLMARGSPLLAAAIDGTHDAVIDNHSPVRVMSLVDDLLVRSKLTQADHIMLAAHLLGGAIAATEPTTSRPLVLGGFLGVLRDMLWTFENHAVEATAGVPPA